MWFLRYDWIFIKIYFFKFLEDILKWIFYFSFIYKFLQIFLKQLILSTGENHQQNLERYSVDLLGEFKRLTIKRKERKSRFPFIVRKYKFKEEKLIDNLFQYFPYASMARTRQEESIWGITKFLVWLIIKLESY